MLENDESNRPDFKGLRSKMPPYDEIVNFLNSNQNHITNYSDLSN